MYIPKLFIYIHLKTSIFYVRPKTSILYVHPKTSLFYVRPKTSIFYVRPKTSIFYVMKLGFGIEINSILRPGFICPEAVQCILIQCSGI